MLLKRKYKNTITPFLIWSLLNLVDGRWSTNRPFSECNVTCGNGYKEKILQCDNPKPEHGGKKCSCDTIFKDAEFIQDHHYRMRQNIQDIFCNETTAIITKDCAMSPCPGDYVIILSFYDSG